MPSNADEQAIRDLISNWLKFTSAGDVDAILRLMAEDVVFLLPGQAPMKGAKHSLLVCEQHCLT